MDQVSLISQNTNRKWRRDHAVDLTALKRWKIRKLIAETMLPGFETRRPSKENPSNDLSVLKIKSALIKNLQAQRYNKNFISYDGCKDFYQHICLSLSFSKNHWEALQRTLAEHEFQKQLNEHSNLTFLTNVWIGHRNVDYFFPMIGGHVQGQQRRHLGLIVEIDGGTHFSERKERRDLSAEALSDSLNFAFKRYENDAVFNGQTRIFAQHLSSFPRLDERARKRVMTRVYGATIFSHASVQALSGFFKVDFADLEQLIYQLRGAHEE